MARLLGFSALFAYDRLHRFTAYYTLHGLTASKRKSWQASC